MFANSARRVPAHTAEEVNERIRRCTEGSIAYYAAHPDQIEQRLFELDQEWDIERALETAASTFSLTGLILGITRSSRWLILPLVVQAFFLQHALQGWCPPLPALRRLGFRTRDEIDRERYALKALRGDFEQAAHAEPDQAPARAFAATGDHREGNGRA
jgi:hypothetical protein